DSRRIVFASDREGAFALYEKSSSGAGKDDLLLKTGNSTIPSDWSPDNRFLLYFEFHPRTRYDLWMLPLTGDRKPVPFLQTEFNELLGAISPNGKWIAYMSDESGRFEIYVQAFPQTGAKQRISQSGGMHPIWRSDGKELFYRRGDL